MKPDGNVAFKVTWVYGRHGPFSTVCTAEGRVTNIRREKKIWCSDRTSPCRYILEHEENEGEPDEIPCYDAAIFRKWEFGLGLVHRSKTRRGDPFKACHIKPGKLAFLTSRPWGTAERDRLVIGAYRIAALPPAKKYCGHMVPSTQSSRIRVRNLAFAPKFWQFHKQSAGPRWGTGLFRYITDDEAQRLLTAVSKAAKRQAHTT